MVLSRRINRFLFPPLTKLFLLRACCLALATYLFFSYVCLPFRIKGNSMEPTYRSGAFNFCWRPRYLFSSPKRHDVVIVRFAGDSVLLLKRVVALEGEQIEFKDGTLLVNGRRVEEPYVQFPCRWNLPARIVERGCVYVIGDNRSMAIENHYFGQTPMDRILGSPLW